MQPKNQDFAQQLLKTLSEDDNKILDDMILAEGIYDVIVDELKIDHNDEIYVELVKNMLRRQVKDHLIFTIWNNMNEKQSAHLKDFTKQSLSINSDTPHEEILIRLALLYPELRDKMHSSLGEFFRNFIAKFNEIAEA